LFHAFSIPGTAFDKMVIDRDPTNQELPMQMPRSRLILPLAALSLAAVSTVSAQTRVVLPQGSVIIVRTETALESSTARQGETFETVVVDSLGLDNYTVIPGGSRIRGVISVVQPANRQQSGVIEVDFNRLTLPDGTTYPIKGRLTSTDPTERQQIEQSANQRVVLVGGRGGIGALIAGAGSQNASTNSLLGALGSLLSQGQNVNVPAGTPLAVQLEQSVTLRRRGLSRTPGNGSLYTSSTMIVAAQRALAKANYYRGTIDGRMTIATQRALFQYQSDRNLTATGNLDWQTAQSLGLSTGAGGNAGSTNGLLSTQEAATLRRDAQTLVGRARQELSISSVGQLSSRRNYSAADLELWFALSAFSDNSALYEQLIRTSSRSAGADVAGRALVNAARRVDSAIQNARPSNQLQSDWSSIRSRISGMDTVFPQ
jgi:peptidoglycan hydrolase-like protein with peptidoglycan-binding domain